MPPAVPPLQRNWAFFLDLDGTLLDIADTPTTVDRRPGEILAARQLPAPHGGALALISGRPLARIDQLFSPLVLPAAGQHGAERRDAQGRRHRHRFPVQSLRPAAGGIRSFAARHQGLVFEDKGASVALHYRLAPQLARGGAQAVREAAEPLGDAVEVQGGKMVVELKPAGCDKGSAIESFMQRGALRRPRAGVPRRRRHRRVRLSRRQPPRRPLGEGRRRAERGALAPGESGGGARLAGGVARVPAVRLGVKIIKGVRTLFRKRVLTPFHENRRRRRWNFNLISFAGVRTRSGFAGKHLMVQASSTATNKGERRRGIQSRVARRVASRERRVLSYTFAEELAKLKESKRQNLDQGRPTDRWQVRWRRTEVHALVWWVLHPGYFATAMPASSAR